MKKYIKIFIPIIIIVFLAILIDKKDVKKEITEDTNFSISDENIEIKNPDVEYTEGGKEGVIMNEKLGGGAPSPQLVSPFDFNGEIIKIEYTNLDNTFEIVGQRDTTSGWGWAEYIFSIENKTQATSTGLITFYGVDILEANILIKNAEKQKTVNELGDKIYICEVDWIKLGVQIYGANGINYICGASVKRDCNIVSGKNCTVKNSIIGTHQETYYKDEWQELSISDSARTTQKVPSEFKATKNISSIIGNGEKKLYKIKIPVLLKTTGEFLIEWYDGVNSSVIR